MSRIDEVVAYYDGTSSPSTPHFVFQDAGYNVVGVTNSNGTLEEQYTYTPYGRRLTAETVEVDADTNETIVSPIDITTSLDGLALTLGYKGLRQESETGFWYSRNRDLDSILGRFRQKDPNETGLLVASALRRNAESAMAFASVSTGSQFDDGMNLYQYVQSDPVAGRDPGGLRSLAELLTATSISAYIQASMFAAAHPLAIQFTQGLVAAFNLYAFAKYEEVQAIVVAQPNPVGLLAADATAVRMAIGEVLGTSGSITALRDASSATRALATRAEETVQGLVRTGGKGGLYIVPGARYSASERTAAEYVASLGRDVVLRPPTGSRVAGGTSDLLVDGLPYDVYTPVTSSSDQIVRQIAKKADQAVGVVVDMSQSTVLPSDLGDVIARLSGKGITTIQEVIIMPK